MQNDLEQILIDSSRIATRVREVAEQIARDLANANAQNDSLHDREHHETRAVTIVPILTGSIIFLADLIRHLPMYLQIQLISVSSYPGSKTTPGKLKILTDLHAMDLAGKDVLLVDDILDSGQTLAAVTRELESKKIASLRTCVLLHKKRETPAVAQADYVCFDIPDEFVVGYGLDYNDYYRNLPYIATLRPEAINRHAKQVVRSAAQVQPDRTAAGRISDS